MIDPFEHFLFILAAWLVCVAVRRIPPASVLTAFGVVFVGIYAPLAALWIAFTAIEAAILFVAIRNRDRASAWRKYGMYLVLPNFFVVDIHPFVLGMNIETLAISFSTVRIFMTGKQLVSSRKPETLREVWWIFVAAFWLPAILVGPVFSGLRLREQAAERQIENVELRDYRLVLQGLVLAILANPLLARVGDVLTTGEVGLAQWVIAPILFLQLFFAFWGQSLVAEHTSRFFGFCLPVNFDEPWKARDIREFWQRWHRSMAEFVIRYIFLPLQLRGVSPKLATIAAFVFMGLWHNLSLGYAIWGVAHGLLMAFWEAKKETRLQRVYARGITWTVVVALSYTANFGLAEYGVVP